MNDAVLEQIVQDVESEEHQGKWELRWHPLREEWVIMAAHRQNRPWSGETAGNTGATIPAYDPTCYLCPGNSRVSGMTNPHYVDSFVFDNDHPSVGLDAPQQLEPAPGIYRNKPATGIARVICYSPQHNLTLAEMEPSAIQNVVATWQRQMDDLVSHPQISSVVIFENKGEVSGVSNPHPHGQIYATNFVFNQIEKQAEVGRRHLYETGSTLFADIITTEQQSGDRIIFENETAIAFIPYFGRYAYEVYIAPKASHETICTLSDAEVVDYVEALHHVQIKFDNLWQRSFPYVMMLQQAPTDGGDYRGFHFHIQFYPPLRKPNLLKYLGGPESGGGNFTCDTLPREKAAELRGLSDVHYKKI